MSHGGHGPSMPIKTLLGPEKKRGRNFIRYNLSDKGMDFYAKKLDPKPPEPPVVEEYGVPAWVTESPGSEEYTYYTEKLVGDNYIVRNGYCGAIINKNNKTIFFHPEKDFMDPNKHEQFNELKEKGITEEIEVLVDNKPLDLESNADFQRSEGKLPLKSGEFLHVLEIAVSYNAKKDGETVGKLKETFRFVEGHGLNHIVEGDVSLSGKKSVNFKWTFNPIFDTINTMVRTSPDPKKEREFTGKLIPHELRNDPESVYSRADETIMDYFTLDKGKDQLITKKFHDDQGKYDGSEKMIKSIRASKKEVIQEYGDWDKKISLNYATVYSWNNPNLDGWVQNGSNGKFSGSSYKNTFVEVTTGGTRRRPYFEWPLSSGVQGAAAIYEVRFRFHQVQGNPNQVEFKRMEIRPSSGSVTGTGIYNEIDRNDPVGGIPAVLHADIINLGGGGENPNSEIILGAVATDDACQHVFAWRANGWWAVGIRYSAEAADGRRVNMKTEEALSAATPKPTLYIVY